MLLSALAVAGGLLLVNDVFFFESVVVPSSSMRPTILPNERLFLRKFPTSPFKRFDLVVAEPPTFGRRVAKRVIGLPGERLRVEGGWKVFINGTPLAYSAEQTGHVRTEADDHLILAGPPSPGATDHEEVLLGPDEYYLLGDNRNDSQDSRVFGPVARTCLEGTLVAVWYSYDLSLHEWRWSRLMHRVR